MRLWFSSAPTKDKTSAGNENETSNAPAFDADKWRQVMEHDPGVAAVVENLRQLGDKWVNEFARSYLSLGDKKDTWRVVQRVIENARRERELGLGVIPQRGAADRRGSPRG